MKKVLLVIGVVAGVGMLWFAYYAISPLFINIKVNEALPGYVQEEEPAETAEVSVPKISEQTTPTSSVQQSAPAPVVDTPAHPASGVVRVVEADGKIFVRYENYKTINGPDLYVYLAKDLEANEHVDLGRLKATEGNINYEVPAGVDVSEYRYVLTWCKQFGVLFNSADLRAL